MSALVGRFLLVRKGTPCDRAIMDQRTAEVLNQIKVVQTDAGLHAELPWSLSVQPDDEGLVLYVSIDLPNQLQLPFKESAAWPATSEALADATRAAIRRYAPELTLACSVSNTRRLEAGDPIAPKEVERRRASTKHHVGRWNSFAKAALMPEALPVLPTIGRYLGRGLAAKVTGRVNSMSRSFIQLVEVDVLADSSLGVEVPRFESLTVERTEAFMGQEAGARFQQHMDHKLWPRLELTVVLKRCASDGGVLPEALLVAFGPANTRL